MSPHNKRNKAKAAAAKESRADRGHNRGGGGGGNYHSSSYRSDRSHRGRGGSYLSTATDFKQNRVQHTFSSNDPLDRQIFDYIIVVDVEATCEEGRRSYPNEVIEIPGVLINVRTGQVEKAKSFHTYVKPWRNPTLTPFCTALTGITQKTVDAAPSITEAIKMFEAWYKETIPRGAKTIFAADGPWDFKNFFHENHVLRDHVSLPSLFYEYLDIRTTFAHRLNHGVPIKLDAMLRKMGLKFEGRPHNGFDDACNIARLAVAMMRAGCVFDFVIAVPLDDPYHYHLEGYPLYRREEGSGSVDRDVVEDIAKQCFAADYFAFGQRHREAVRAYRLEHPNEFSNANIVALKRRSDRALARRRQRMWRMLVLVLIAVLVVGVAYVLQWHRTVAAWLRAKVGRQATATTNATSANEVM